MKWILLSIALVVGGVFAWFQSQSVKVSYVNGLSRYTDLPMREFRFEEDCYILRTKGSHAAWPLVSNHRLTPELPAKVTEDQIGKTYGDHTILATVQIGAIFKLISVRREIDGEHTRLSYEIVFLDEAERPYPRLDARLLLHLDPSDQEAPPTFDARAVVPRAKI